MLLHTIAKYSNSWQHKLQRLDGAGQVHGISLCKNVTTSNNNHNISKPSAPRALQPYIFEIPHDINIWTSACLHFKWQVPFYKRISIPTLKFMYIFYIQYKHHISIQIIFEQKNITHKHIQLTQHHIKMKMAPLLNLFSFQNNWKQMCNPKCLPHWKSAIPQHMTPSQTFGLEQHHLHDAQFCEPTACAHWQAQWWGIENCGMNPASNPLASDDGWHYMQAICPGNSLASKWKATSSQAQHLMAQVLMGWSPSSS